MTTDSSPHIPLTDEEVDAIEARANAATPGPWFTVDLPWRDPEIGTFVIAGNSDPHAGKPVCDSIEIMEWDADEEHPDYSQSDTDLTFIAASRTDLPRLIAEVRALRALLVELTADAEAGITRNDWGGYCIYCGKHITQLHAPDCPIARAREMLKP